MFSDAATGGAAGGAGSGALHVPRADSRWSAGACAHCGLIPPAVALSGCSRCHREWYCCREHQKAHFARHKTACKAIAKLMASDEAQRRGAAVTDGPGISDFCQWSLSTLRTSLASSRADSIGAEGRDPHVRAMLLDPRVCCVCCKMETMSGGPTGIRAAATRHQIELVACGVCRSAWHCSSRDCAGSFEESHGPGKSTECRAAALMSKANAMSAPTEGETTYGPQWVLQRALESHITQLPADWTEYHKQCAWDRLTPTTALDGVRVVASNEASYPMLIMRGLRAVSFVDLLTAKTVRIHVVGLRQSPLMPQYEQLLHLLPSAQHLWIRFVGPQLPEASKIVTSGWATRVLGHDDADTSYGKNSDVSGKDIRCLKCQSGQREVHCAFARGTYHQHLFRASWASPTMPPEEYEPTGPPDLIVCFNSGIHQHPLCGPGDTWAPTLAMWVTMNVPIVLSAATKSEATKCARRMQESGFHIAVEPTANTLHGTIPRRSSRWQCWDHDNSWWLMAVPDSAIDAEVEELREATRQADSAARS